MYEVKQIRRGVWGVYSKDRGSTGGWHLIRTFYDELDALIFRRTLT